MVAVGLQDSTSAERVERERGRGVEQSSRKRWREEITSVQLSGTPYGECGALHTSAHTHSAEEEEEERASRALSLVQGVVTYAPPVEAFATGIKNFDRRNRPLIA